MTPVDDLPKMPIGNVPRSNNARHFTRAIMRTVEWCAAAVVAVALSPILGACWCYFGSRAQIVIARVAPSWIEAVALVMWTIVLITAPSTIGVILAGRFCRNIYTFRGLLQDSKFDGQFKRLSAGKRIVFVVVVLVQNILYLNWLLIFFKGHVGSDR